jgi:hypothetical protein
LWPSTNALSGESPNAPLPEDEFIQLQDTCRSADGRVGRTGQAAPRLRSHPHEMKPEPHNAGSVAGRRACVRSAFRHYAWLVLTRAALTRRTMAMKTGWVSEKSFAREEGPQWRKGGRATFRTEDGA